MLTGETLDFLNSRHLFWKNNSTKRSTNNSTQNVSRMLDFDSIGLSFLEDDNPLKDSVEVIDEKYKLKKYYNFEDMYDASSEIDTLSIIDDIEELLD